MAKGNTSNDDASSSFSSTDYYDPTILTVIGTTLLLILMTSSYITKSPSQSKSQSLSPSQSQSSLPPHKRLYQQITTDLPLYILTNHRSTIVVLFGLPLSLLWDTLLRIRSYYIHTFSSAPHLHAQRVKTIVEQVKHRPNVNAPLCTARPGWMSVSLSYRDYKKKWNAIEMPLYDILSTNIHDDDDNDTNDDNDTDDNKDDNKDCSTSMDDDRIHETNQSTSTHPKTTKSKSKSKINPHQKIVHVEPFVTIGQLTHYLNPLGYTLPVVPEMDDLTIGGLINGTGIESSSHTHGLFHEIITEIEVCLGNGTVVVATADNEYSDLFYAVPWSYGTIGLLLSAKLKLIRCQEFVKLTYLPFYDKEEYIQELRLLSGELNGKRNTSTSTHANGNQGHDCDDVQVPMFLEGLVYTKDDAVIMKGEFISKKDIPKHANINRLSLWFKPWFYKHVQSILESNKHKKHDNNTDTALVEYIPLRDYYHRHTQSLFWEMELMIPIGNHPLFRYLLGWLMPPKVSFLKISQTEMTRQLVEKTHVAQDFLVPTRNMSDFLTLCDEQFDQIYPLWLCLHNHTSMPGSILRDPMGGKDEMYIDIGVYGLPRCVHEKREEEFDMKRSMRTVVEDLKGMNGFQMLYADVFSTREEFEEIFDHEGYRMIRKKYKADTGVFKEVYDKMSVVL